MIVWKYFVGKNFSCAMKSTKLFCTKSFKRIITKFIYVSDAEILSTVTLRPSNNCWSWESRRHWPDPLQCRAISLAVATSVCRSFGCLATHCKLMCIMRGFGYERLVKEMLKMGGNSSEQWLLVYWVISSWVLLAMGT